MFVEYIYIYIYIYIYEQYNPETARRNTPKLKHSIPIEKTKHLPKRNCQSWLEVFKKTEKSIKLRKPEKKNQKNRTVKKNRLKFWKNRPVRFSFYFISLKPKKKNRIESKVEKQPSQTEKTESSRFEPVFVQKTNWNKTGRFEPVLVFSDKK